MSFQNHSNYDGNYGNDKRIQYRNVSLPTTVLKQKWIAMFCNVENL